jgi:DNA polymerase III epsilon subunit-like protein
MNHIVLDLEFNQPFNKTIINKECPHEIIEIGAIKLNDNYDVIDTFRVFVKPIYYKAINKNVSWKTGIKTNDLEYGIDFNIVISDFTKWIGNEYIIYTWSDNDYRVMKMNCEFHRFNYTWMDNFIDLQEQYKNTKNDINVKGLRKAVQELNIPIKRVSHTALNDCYYLAEILKYLNGVKIQQTKSEENNKKYVESKYRHNINCPLCGRFLKILYKSSKFPRGHKYIIISECNHCNVCVQYSVQKIDKGIELKYRTNTKIIDENTYKSFINQFTRY